MNNFLKRWLITTVAVLVAAHIVPGIQYSDLQSLLVATLALGLLNAFVRPLLMALSFSLLIFTLGLFTLVINAMLLQLVGHLISGFHVASFGTAFWGGLVISIVSGLLNLVTGGSKVVVKPAGGQGNSSTASTRGRGGDDGPVIDV